MIGITAAMGIALAVLLGLALTPGGDSFETRVNHSPWRAYERDLNSVENSYQYYYPYYQQRQQQQNYNKKDNYYQWNYPTRDQAKKKKVNSNRWKHPSSTNSFLSKDKKKKSMFDDWNNFLPNIDMNKIKMPTFPSVRKFTTTKRPMHNPAMTTREWPAYHLLPPIRMISPSMDEPPQPSRRG